MDTVVISQPDDTSGVIGPTLQDGIAAIQYYWLLIEQAQKDIAADVVSVNNSTTECLQASQAALTAATQAAATAAAAVLPAINRGSPTMASRSRLRRALSAGKHLQAVDDYVMNTYDRYSDVYLEWMDGVFFPTNALVYEMIQVALGWTGDQTNALWASAYALPD
jgi:hypothetical protein